MAQKPYVIESQQREARQRQYAAAPELKEKFPSIKEVVVELSFNDPEGKVNPSPHKRIFIQDMQAFFEFPCPLRECNNGGYSLSKTIMESLSSRRTELNGKMSCKGKRSRDKAAATCCDLELNYRVTAYKKDKAAA